MRIEPRSVSLTSPFNPEFPLTERAFVRASVENYDPKACGRCQVRAKVASLGQGIMKPIFRALVVLVGLLALAGCQFGASVVGTVVDMLSGRPVPNATVRFYRGEAMVSSSGCFAIRRTMDDGEMEVSVSAPGYKPLLLRPDERVPGSYEAVVRLMPAGSTGESQGRLEKIAQAHYDVLARACPIPH